MLIFNRFSYGTSLASSLLLCYVEKWGLSRYYKRSDLGNGETPSSVGRSQWGTTTTSKYRKCLLLPPPDITLTCRQMTISTYKSIYSLLQMSSSVQAAAPPKEVKQGRTDSPSHCKSVRPLQSESRGMDKSQLG
jgi:hypothetical protein